MPARTWEGSCSGDSSHGKVKIEETDGSSSGQKEYDILVEEELSTLATQFSAEGVWTGK